MEIRLWKMRYSFHSKLVMFRLHVWGKSTAFNAFSDSPRHAKKKLFQHVIDDCLIGFCKITWPQTPCILVTCNSIAAQEENRCECFPWVVGLAVIFFVYWAFPRWSLKIQFCRVPQFQLFFGLGKKNNQIDAKACHFVSRRSRLLDLSPISADLCTCPRWKETPTQHLGNAVNPPLKCHQKWAPIWPGLAGKILGG